MSGTFGISSGLTPFQGFTIFGLWIRRALPYAIAQRPLAFLQEFIKTTTQTKK